MMKFKSKVEDIDIFKKYFFFGIDSENFDIEEITCGDIEWRVEVDYREWGIKGLTIFAPEQDVTFNIEVRDLNTDVLTSREKKITISDFEVNQDNVKFEGSLCPTELALYNGKWTLGF